MKGEELAFFINVPINEDGKQAILDLQEFDEADFLVVSFTYSEFKSLEPLFSRFNRSFGLQIQDCATEVLPSACVEDAYSIARAFSADSATAEDQRAAVAKMMPALERANKLAMPVEFDF